LTQCGFEVVVFVALRVSSLVDVGYWRGFSSDILHNSGTVSNSRVPAMTFVSAWKRVSGRLRGKRALLPLLAVLAAAQRALLPLLAVLAAALLLDDRPFDVAVGISRLRFGRRAGGQSFRHVGDGFGVTVDLKKTRTASGELVDLNKEPVFPGVQSKKQKVPMGPLANTGREFMAAYLQSFAHTKGDKVAGMSDHAKSTFPDTKAPFGPKDSLLRRIEFAEVDVTGFHYDTSGPQEGGAGAAGEQSMVDQVTRAFGTATKLKAGAGATKGGATRGGSYAQTELVNAMEVESGEEGIPGSAPATQDGYSTPPTAVGTGGASPRAAAAVQGSPGQFRLLRTHPVLKHGLLAASHKAFTDHYHLVLTPEVIMTTIAQGMATVITENADAFRGSFVGFDGKRELVVIADDLRSFFKDLQGDTRHAHTGSAGQVQDNVFVSFSRV